MNSVLFKMKKLYKEIRHFFGKRKYCFFANRGNVSLSQKIVVFESDDWGTLRTFNKDEFVFLSGKYGQANDPFIKYDSLETKDDVFNLIRVLKAHKDCKDKHPVFTLNFGLWSPDIERIIDSGYKTFYSLDLLGSYSFAKKEAAFANIREGIKDHLFVPQLHAAHHINVQEWMTSLQNNEVHRVIVGHRCLDFDCLKTPGKPFLFMDEMRDLSDDDLKDYLIKANEDFKSVFGFYSDSFIPCCNVIAVETDAAFIGSSVDCVQGSPYFFSYDSKKKRYKKHSRKWKREGIVHLVRNCLFEPSINGPGFDSVAECMWQIKQAFKHKKPAIICTHRLNFISSLDQENGQNGVHLLDRLLTEIETKYPDVIYLSSDELYRRIKNGN